MSFNGFNVAFPILSAISVIAVLHFSLTHTRIQYI